MGFEGKRQVSARSDIDTNLQQMSALTRHA